MSYSDRLKAMKLTSIQRRFDRYRVIYTKKILMNKVPNMGIEVLNDCNHRNGIILYTGDKKKLSMLRRHSFIIRGPELFNSLPMDLRNHDGSLENFKTKLDDFLEWIPDITRLEGPLSYTHNNLDDRISKWIWSMRQGYDTSN